ncbi:heparinase II/III domain-containing protein [Sphaerotilus sulfidivorans]|uniref:heparinase II/III domain-containing protein n=1 Tax=Sphaerotilus sp. FB-3 TaxID=2913396 RepID=UPI00203FB1D1|nr:heparinase II/III family protein [Sphaerotilus sp. FB-3]
MKDRREFLKKMAMIFSAQHEESAAHIKQTSYCSDNILGNNLWERMIENKKNDAKLSKLIDLLISSAKSDIKINVLKRNLQGGRLLSVSREFVRRILQWSFAFRLTGDSLFLDRLKLEIENVIFFDDWNPNHFLDVAEIVAGISISWDWIFDFVDDDFRAKVADAIVKKGLMHVENGHKTFGYKNNWSQVCIGGMALGAVTVRNYFPDVSRKVIDQALFFIENSLKIYEPDGVYPEGPSYWSYGTIYSLFFLLTLRGRKDINGAVTNSFLKSSYFYAQSIGPSGLCFNFSDSMDVAELSPALAFFSSHLHDISVFSPIEVIIEKFGWNLDRFSTILALWWPNINKYEKKKVLSDNFIGGGPQQVAIKRFNFNDDLGWVAIKGGGANITHAHMDAGSFVFDAMGVRWAKDLGMQNYYSLESAGLSLWDGSQNSERWSVYRIGPFSHNTITINQKKHNVSGFAEIKMVGENVFEINMSSVLGVPLATRKFIFSESHFSIIDTIENGSIGDVVRWAMCTEANIILNGLNASMSIGGKLVYVVFSGEIDSVDVFDISLPKNSFDSNNNGVNQLVVSGSIKNNLPFIIEAKFFW